MATTGLQRRRVANASTSSMTGGGADDSDEEKVHKSYSNGNGHERNTPVGHAGSAFAMHGSKIAYDPRDIADAEGEEKRVGGKIPRLTIMEEVLLLGIKDKQGYLSFWNDNISYALRGAILIELALRRRIALVRDPNRKRLPLPERIVEVIDDRQTGETILDEALKMMKSVQGDVVSSGKGERSDSSAVDGKMSVNSWIDLLSGETWNVLKIGFQLKQVRERLAKGLVDKGILRTEKRNFLLFDMATHPIADIRAKDSVVNRAISLLTSTTSALPDKALLEDGTQARKMRAVSSICVAYTGSVLDNAFGRLGYEEREAAFSRAEDILSAFSQWPFAGDASSSSSSRRRQGSRIATGSTGDVGRESVSGLVQEVKKEQSSEEDLGYELVAGVLEVLSKLDSLL